MLTGLFFSLLAWGSTAYSHIHLSLTQEVLGISITMLAFGITGGILGINKLMDNISNINL